jgi:hypothetical protein
VNVVGWVLAPENRLDKPEPALAGVNSIALALGEPIVAVEQLIGSAIPERFEHVLHSTNLGIGGRACACRLDDHPCDFDWSRGDVVSSTRSQT